MNKTNQDASDVVVEVVIRNVCHVNSGSDFVNDPREIKSDPWKFAKPKWYENI